MRLSLLARVSPFALAVLPALLFGCRSRALDAAAVGPLGGVDDVDFAPYMAVAHAVVTHAPKPDAAPPAHPGRRVFVTFWSPGHAAVRATGLGATLLDSVTLASDEVAKAAIGEGRVEIDVLTSAEPASVSGEMRDPISGIGMQGYLASDRAGHVGFVTPGEMIEGKLADLSTAKEGTVTLFADKIRALLATRAAVDPAAVEGMRIGRFGVSAHVEASTPGKPPIALLRSMPLRNADVTADELFAGVRAAADHLARMVDATGRFVDYDYDPVADGRSDPADYSLIRHAGAAYRLMEAFDEMRVPAWRDAAERAFGYLLTHATRTADDAYVTDGDPLHEQEKLGGAGISLVALAEYQAVTGDNRYLEWMRGFARFIVHQQYPDGHFRGNVDVVAENPKLKRTREKEVFFYVGEAELGLARLYALEPMSAWLDPARKGADWVIDVRDAHEDLNHQVNDQWMSYALHDLYVLTGDKRYADHAFKIAHAIEAAELRPPPAPDFAGSFSDRGEFPLTSVRVEALASDIQLARFKGDDESWLRALAMRYATFTYRGQLNDENDFFARNPARVRGAVRESMLSDDLRIDFDGHSASAWLRLAREIRDPSWGKKK